jgi:hypothetical protein
METCTLPCSFIHDYNYYFHIQSAVNDNELMHKTNQWNELIYNVLHIIYIINN